MENVDKIEYFQPNDSIKNKLLNMGLGIYNSIVLERRLTDIKDIEDDELKLFLYKEVNSFPIEEMGDINKLVDIFRTLDIHNSHVLIVSDYDCDGISSALMSTFALKDVFKFDNVTTLVNKRRDGTGYNKKLVDKILEINKNKKVDLLISFDHGSCDEESYKVIKNNMDAKIVITDHHLPDLDNLPNSVDVFINPHNKGETNENLDISGCAVGFITLLYTYMYLHNKSFKEGISLFKSVLPFVCISTISDVMPLSNKYNRYFVKIGLNEINSFRNTLWTDVRNHLDLGAKITVKDISHKIAPLINTGNRISVEEHVFTTFNELDLEQRKLLFSELINYNKIRKSEVQHLVAVTKDYIRLNKLDLDADSGLVLLLNSELSLNGIVAANIGDTYQTPVVCFNNSESENISGSIRGILDGINIMEILHKIETEDADVLNGYGGHTGAGGCNIKKSKLDNFTKLFKKYVTEFRSQNLEGKTLLVDFSIRNTLVNHDLYNEITLLEPYGKDWEEPIIHSKFKIGGFRGGASGCMVLLKTMDGRVLSGFYRPNEPIEVIEKKLAYGSIVDVYFKLGLNYRVPYQLSLDIVHI